MLCMLCTPLVRPALASLAVVPLLLPSMAAASASKPAGADAAAANEPAQHRIYLGSYDGVIQALTFTPPSTLSAGARTDVTVGAGADASSAGVSWLAFLPADRASGAADRTSGAAGAAGAGHVYAVDERAPGRVLSYAVADARTGALRPVGSAQQAQSGTSSGGDGPVALAFASASTSGQAPDTENAERCLFVANYNSGSVGVLALERDGRIAASSGASSSASGASSAPSSSAPAAGPAAVIQLTRAPGGPAVGPVTNRQDHSYAHEVVTSPCGRFVLVPDLGADAVHALRVGGGSGSEDGKAAASADTRSACARTTLAHTTYVTSGSGPRHIAFYPPGQSTVGGRMGAHGPGAGSTDNETVHAYLASEFGVSLTAFAFDGSSGALTQLGAPVSAVPEGTALGGTSADGPMRTVSEVAVSPDGRFVYVADRGDAVSDHISIFARDGASGRVTFRKWVPTGGRNVRHFALSLDAKARFLAVGHQQSGGVVLFSRDPETGDITPTGARYDGLQNVAFSGFAPF